MNPHVDMAETLAELEQEAEQVMRELAVEVQRGTWQRRRPADTAGDRARRRAELARNWRDGDP